MPIEKKNDRGGTLLVYGPGESGNPNGRPKGSKNLKTITRQLLAEITEVSVDGVKKRMSRGEALIYEKYRIAVKGENDAVRLRAIMDIEDRQVGRPVQQFGLEQGDDPIEGVQEGSAEKIELLIRELRITKKSS